MTKPIDKTSTELFQMLRSRFSPVNLGDDEAAATSDPTQARFFSFIYKENGEALGPISISLINNRSLKIFYSSDLINSMKDSATWYEFLKELRFFSKRNLLNFDARDINKDQLDTRDYNFIKQQDGPYQEKDVEVTESSMFGSRRKSYQTMENARVVVTHRKSVDENVRGARSRYIESIFIECNGERFRFPVNYLNGARAMAVHISEGGTPYDDMGQHIIGTVAEMQNLSKFARLTRKHAMEDGEAGDIRARVIEAYNAKKKSIMRLHNPKNYREYAESYVADSPAGDSDVTQLKERFTLKVWNENMEDLLPSVQRALEGYTMAEDYRGPEAQDDEDMGPLYPTDVDDPNDEDGPMIGADGDYLRYIWNDEEHVEEGIADMNVGIQSIPASQAHMDRWAKIAAADCAVCNKPIGGNKAGLILPVGDRKVAMHRVHADPFRPVPADVAAAIEQNLANGGGNYYVEETATEGMVAEAAPSVERQITSPGFTLTLRKDPAADAMIRSAKFTNGGGLLGFILSDIASRAIGNDIDAVANFASEMALQVGEEGQSFGTKMTPEYKKDKQLAMLLAKKYLDDMKQMAADPAYAAQVRKDPGEVYGAKKTRTGGFHEAVDAFEAWANAIMEAAPIGTTGTAGTVAPSTAAKGMTNQTVVKAISGGDPNKARDIKRVSDKLARGQRLSPAEQPIAGEIAKDVMTTKKTTSAMQALAQDKYTQMEGSDPLGLDKPGSIRKIKGKHDTEWYRAISQDGKGSTFGTKAGAEKHAGSGKKVAESFGHNDDDEEGGASGEDIAAAIMARLQSSKSLLPNLLRAYGLDAVDDAINDVAYDNQGATELGSSDVSILVTQVLDRLSPDRVEEGMWDDENSSPYDDEDDGATVEDIYDSILHRLKMSDRLTELLRSYGLDAVEDAITSVAEFHEGANELGSSDISIMVKQVLDQLGVKESTIVEKTLNVKADQDFDGDGELESPQDEYAGSKDRAIKRAMKKPVDAEDEKNLAESLTLLKKYAGI